MDACMGFRSVSVSQKQLQPELQRSCGAPANTGDCTVELFCRVYEVPCSACMARVTDLRHASGGQEMTNGQEIIRLQGLKAKTRYGAAAESLQCRS